MNKSYLCFLALLMTSPLLLANSTDVNNPTRNNALAQTNINFSLNLVEPTCVVSSQSQNMVINLGNWNTKYFKKTGSQSRPVPFQINLEDCKTDFVSIAFQGEVDASNSHLLALNQTSTVKNVAIQFFEAQDVLLKLNTFTQAKKVNDQKANFQLSANFISTSDEVSPGTASADAMILLKYQ